MKEIRTHHSTNLNLKISLLLGALYFVILTLGSLYSGSLSLAASAGHMLMHLSVLGIAFTASQIAVKSANTKFSAGFGRVESIAALINSILLVLTGLFLLHEIGEAHSHHDLHEVNSDLMGIIAFVGLLLHSISAYLLYQSRKESLNIHAAFLHLFFDVLVTIATFVTAIALHLGADTDLDKHVATLIAVIIVLSGARLFWMSIKQLMDATPAHLSIEDIIATLKKIEHVKDVHHVIIRGSGHHMALSAHIVLASHCIHGGHWISCRQEAEDILQSEFGIPQTILQMEVDEDHAHNCDHHSHS